MNAKCQREPVLVRARMSMEREKRRLLLDKLDRTDVAADLDLLCDTEKAALQTLEVQSSKMEVAQLRLDHTMSILRDF